jgi:hypothetical protein
MTVAETLELARSCNVEVRLNAAGDGLNLEVEADPPQALMNVLRRTKWDIVASLRQHELDRRRPLIARRINDHFVSTPPNICRHCGEGVREGDAFVRLYCGDDSGDVHTSCQPAWREAAETEAGVALGLGPLTGLFDRHFPLLYYIDEARPHDVNDAGWDVAMRGLRTFLATGGADEALRLGWTKDELFRIPPVWARGDLCGVGLLIGDREVIEVTPAEIRIKIASGATQSFFRRPEPDLALVYRERLRLFGLDASSEEVQLRALEHTVRFCRDHRNCDFETAKAAVLSAIKRSSSSPGVLAR